MKKTQAHLILLLIDIAAVVAVVYVFNTFFSIINGMSQGLDSVSYQTKFTLLLLLIYVPLIHLWSYITQCWQLSAANEKRIGQLIAVSFIAVFILALALNWHINASLSGAGYQYCAEQSRYFTFTEFRVYSRSSELCTSL